MLELHRRSSSSTKTINLKTLTTMINQFTQYLEKIRGFSPRTSLAYGKDLRAFAQFMKQQRTGARWSNITREDLDAFICWQCNEGLAPATTNRRLSAISSFYNYLRREGYEVNNPCRYQSRRKLPKRLPNTLNCEELSRAYQQSSGCVKLMLGLLITTGMRLQEMLELTWEDIDTSTGTINIHGKGNKERRVKTTAEIAQFLHEIGRTQNPKARLFGWSQRETRYCIFNALKSQCHGKQLSPHAIRHTIATHMAGCGISTIEIARLLGHESLDTTQKYINMAEAERADANIQTSII